MNNPNNADWKGMLRKRFSWRTFSFRYGRWCFQTNCFGQTVKCWWEWEKT